MAETKKKSKSKKKGVDIDFEEMMRAGVHFGHQSSRSHPKMAPFVYGTRNSIDIIDLEKTAQFLEGALGFIEEFVSQGKTILFIGTKVQHKGLVKEIAKDCGFPYVAERWLGGTFTNFEVIKKRIQYHQELKKKKDEGGFENYTKKERARIDRKLKNLEIKFGGIEGLTRLPDAIFVADIEADALAIEEARSKGIKVIGIADTNVDPGLADYPIPANTNSVSSVKYILDKVKEVIKKNKQATPAPDASGVGAGQASEK